ncbi:MAG: hypothetical protein ACFFFK_10500 [Candidatus Thorarchaeota archaeon]
MREGKTEKLDRIMENLVGPGQDFSSCVVTNERGLVVAGSSIEGFSSQILAAMISLMSDTAIRVSENLGYGHPKTSSIKGFGVSISVQEFMVRDRWFRIGAILSDEGQKPVRFFRRDFKHRNVEARLAVVAKKLRSILED